MVCNSCGHYHEAGKLCMNCYNKVKEETNEILMAMIKKQGLRPVEKEVIVLYEGEKQEKSDEELERHTIVELPKERPQWFSKNLLQRTNDELIGGTTVAIPKSELG